MTDRYLDLLQKHRELQKAFNDTLEMNRKFGTENVRLEKENEQLKEQMEKMKNCDNCKNLFECTNKRNKEMTSNKMTMIRFPCCWELAE